MVVVRSGQQFLSFAPLQEALSRLANEEFTHQERGAFFTKREVVEFMLDLVGYTTDVELHKKRFLEPSFGRGDFLSVAIERLLTAYSLMPTDARSIVTDLRDCIRAVELHQETYRETRESVRFQLEHFGASEQEANELLDSWLHQGDFLFTAFSFPFDYVVGNPPYVRQELIPAVLLSEYRRRFETIYDRADLFVPFYEHSLKNLGPGGSLAFICSDRWTKNKYGTPLRRMIATGYHVEFYIDMTGTPAFHADVIAYPAITVIKKGPPGPTRIAKQPLIETEALRALARALCDPSVNEDHHLVEVQGLAQGDQPWLLDSLERVALVRRLEKSFPTLEHAGCKVGIGVATGADDVYIGKFEAMDVEPDRKLPLVMTRDISTGTIKWRGYGVINPFDDEGQVVDLDHYPRLAAYFRLHEETIRRRKVAGKNQKAWYRTIDRVYPSLTNRPKLLIPDIKDQAHVVLDEGAFYPHHNLYYITSSTWNLRALQTILLSGVATLFVEAYSTKMANGFLRFQAQYLRRIRLPHWAEVPDDLKTELIELATVCDPERQIRAVSKVYGLTPHEQSLLMGGERR